MKPVIAVDIDDVLSASAQAFIAFSNRKWGTNLGIEDFDEDWGSMWEISHEQTMARAREFHDSGIISSYDHYDAALPVLQHLQERYSLVVLTSRNLRMDEETKEWINKRYPGLFREVYFSGIYDDVPSDKAQIACRTTKAEMLQRIGASYLIDDQPKHVIGAAEIGLHAILFGLYPWNREADLPSGVTRCETWQKIGEYFDGLI